MVNICKVQLTILQQEILRLLFIKAGSKLNARAISKALGVSQPAVSKALPVLEKRGFILVSKDKGSKRLSIELNREDQKVIWLKRADNLKQVYESGLAQLLYDEFRGAVIILFGSYAFGEDTEDSDIDFVVIGVKKKDIELSQYENTLGRKIVINHFGSFGRIDKPLLNNILNGITLKGAIEL